MDGSQTRRSMETTLVKKGKGEEILGKDYAALLKDLKAKVKSAQLKAAIRVNTEMITLYWEIGRSIHSKQEEHGWGSKTIEKLSRDLRSAFPDMKGFSSRNLKYMLKFARAYSDFEIMQQLAAQIPWFHNIILLERVKEEKYIKKTIEHGWSRSVLEVWLGNGLYEREGKGVNNFERTIASPETDLARETIKDPYCFDFLTLSNQFSEKELESGLFDHLQRFLLEMGDGFAFVGRQKHLSVGGQDFFIDMLFYNYKLRRFFVVELKATDFKPDYIGQLNFYLVPSRKSFLYYLTHLFHLKHALAFDNFFKLSSSSAHVL